MELVNLPAQHLIHIGVSVGYSPGRLRCIEIEQIRIYTYLHD
jgi:hypothetical protein